MMKFSRPLVHHNTAPMRILMVHQPSGFEQGQRIGGFGLPVHRIGDRLLGARA